MIYLLRFIFGAIFFLVLVYLNERSKDKEDKFASILLKLIIGFLLLGAILAGIFDTDFKLF
jgi:ABC-type Mn2+/Zn2+ transport system permease subunit